MMSKNVIHTIHSDMETRTYFVPMNQTLALLLCYKINVIVKTKRKRMFWKVFEVKMEHSLYFVVKSEIEKMLTNKKLHKNVLRCIFNFILDTQIANVEFILSLLLMSFSSGCNSMLHLLSKPTGTETRVQDFSMNRFRYSSLRVHNFKNIYHDILDGSTCWF